MKAPMARSKIAPLQTFLVSEKYLRENVRGTDPNSELEQIPQEAALDLIQNFPEDGT